METMEQTMINNIINALNEYDYDTVEKLAVDIRTTPIESFAHTSLQLLIVCDDEENFPYMIDILQNLNPYTGLHIVNIVTTWTQNRQVVEYTRKYLPELTHLELIDQWITYSGAYFDNIGIACDIYISVYGPISESVMKTMLQDTINANKYDFYEVLFGLYSRSSNYAPIPNWIDDRMTTDKELEDKLQLLDKTLNVNDDILAKHLYDELHVYVEESKDDMVNIISKLDKNSKDTLKTLITGNDDNLTPFFGPSNPFPTYLHDPIQERMFLCNVYIPDVDVEDEPLIMDQDLHDWFDGSCDECGQRIRSYHHCLRLPMLTGGWMGCFCSWKCLQDRADEYKIKGEDEIDISNPLNVTIQDLVTKIKDEIEKRLIYDR